MIKFFLIFKSIFAFSCFLMAFPIFSSGATTDHPDQPSASISIKALIRKIEVCETSSTSPREESSLVRQCQREIEAGKIQKEAEESVRAQPIQHQNLSSPHHQNLLLLTLLHKDIAPSISQCLKELDIHAMRLTCRAAYRAYTNRGTFTLDLRKKFVPEHLQLWLHHNRLARGLLLRGPDLLKLAKQMHDADVSFHLMKQLYLNNTSATPALLTLLPQLFPNMEALDLSGQKPNESQSQLYPNAVGSIPSALQHLPLKELNLRYAQIRNIEAIVGSASLTSLDLTGTPLPPDQYGILSQVSTLRRLVAAWDWKVDSQAQHRLTGAHVSFLQSLPLLEELNLNWHYLENLEPAVLSPLTHLQHLNLGKTDLTSVAFAERFQRLTHVVLRENKLTTVAPLGVATEMVSLDLSHNDLSDLDPLKKMTKLRFLDASKNPKITSLYPLSDCTKMENLSIAANKKTGSLEPLSSMTKMRELNIDTTNTNSLLPLARMMRLKKLNASDNKIKDIGPLAHLASLRTLYLGRNPLLNEDPVYGLKKLMVLHLTDIVMKHPEKLSKLPYLIEIDLNKTGIQTLNMFENLTFLTRLFLDGNNFSDLQIAPLFDLTGLSTLSLKDTPNLSENRLIELRNKHRKTQIITDIF